jgi:hypothetical protein
LQGIALYALQWQRKAVLQVLQVYPFRGTTGKASTGQHNRNRNTNQKGKQTDEKQANNGTRETDRTE